MTMKPLYNALAHETLSLTLILNSTAIPSMLLSDIVSGFQLKRYKPTYSNEFGVRNAKQENFDHSIFVGVFFDGSPSNRKQIFENEMQMTQWPISMLFWKSYFWLTIIDTTKNTKQTSNEYFVRKGSRLTKPQKVIPIRLKSITFFGWSLFQYKKSNR